MVIASYKEPWTTTVWDSLRLYSAQLATAGGSAAIAKTAVYPLERIKVTTLPKPVCTLQTGAKKRKQKAIYAFVADSPTSASYDGCSQSTVDRASRRSPTNT